MNFNFLVTIPESIETPRMQILWIYEFYNLLEAKLFSDYFRKEIFYQKSTIKYFLNSYLQLLNLLFVESCRYQDC